MNKSPVPMPEGPRKAGGAADVGRPAQLTVRPALPGDLTPLTFFFDTVLRKDYFLRRGQLADLVKGRHHQVYVAEIDSVLVGAAVTTRKARLVNVLVHPAYRGLGIGQELVRNSGASEVRAKIDMSTGDPRGFYRAMGFASTGQFNHRGNIELMQSSRGASTRAEPKQRACNHRARERRRPERRPPRGAI